MPIRIEQDILGLEVAIHDVLIMQVVESQRNLSCIEFRNRFGEALWR